MSINSHFVSRFLTEPWEHGQRMLWYYDFDEDRIRSRSSRSLFASVGANSAETEARLNRLVESPIAAARQHLWASGGEVSQTLEWPLFKALALLVLLQPFRASASTEGPQTLEEMLARPESEIDGLVHAIGARYRLMRVTVHPQAPLFYASDGWFPLLTEPMGGPCVFGIAIPISPRHAFIGVPAAADSSQTDIWSANGAGLVSNYSVGHRSRRVVVHPAAVSALPHGQIITAIRESRQGVVQATELCHELSEVVRRMDAMFPS
jgi:hypothetical protein